MNIKNEFSLDKYQNSIKVHPNFLFRGQSNFSWSLTPSFTRIANKKNLSRKKALQLEIEMTGKFSVEAIGVLDIRNSIKLIVDSTRFEQNQIEADGWFTFMQHYSCPTRILDWSVSPYVALYFACQDDSVDGSFWISDFWENTNYSENAINGQNRRELLFSDSSDENIFFMKAMDPNERIHAQQSRFSICTNILNSHEPYLKNHAKLEKIIVKKEIKNQILEELHSMNISAKTLFPGIDGIGRYLNEYCNLWDQTSIINSH